jgi:hypothetical protein
MCDGLGNPTGSPCHSNRCTDPAATLVKILIARSHQNGYGLGLDQVAAHLYGDA